MTLANIMSRILKSWSMPKAAPSISSSKAMMRYTTKTKNIVKMITEGLEQFHSEYSVTLVAGGILALLLKNWF